MLSIMICFMSKMGKVTKAFQFTATDKERTKFLEDLANAKDKVETTTAESYKLKRKEFKRE